MSGPVWSSIAQFSLDTFEILGSEVLYSQAQPGSVQQCKAKL